MKRFLTLLIIVVTLFFIVSCSSVSVSIKAPGSSQTPVLVPKTQNLVNGIITVGAGKHYYVNFTVNTGTMHNIKVIGTFKASGGSGNDIEVLILDDMAYTNWASGHQVSTYYNSGKLTTSNINITISNSGKYYLIFNNGFSTISSKDVTTKVDLDWSE